MAIKVACICGHEWLVHDTLAGKPILCPRCAEETTIPSPERSGPTVEAYYPSSLPEVSAVEVLPFSKGDVADVRDHLRDVSVAQGVRVEGKTARRIADLWRSLPPGTLCATHMPVFGLRFLDGDRVICQASACWIGNTIHGESGGCYFEYGFEALDETAVALYEELKRISGAS